MGHLNSSNRNYLGILSESVMLEFPSRVLVRASSPQVSFHLLFPAEVTQIL